MHLRSAGKMDAEAARQKARERKVEAREEMLGGEVI